MRERDFAEITKKMKIISQKFSFIYVREQGGRKACNGGWKEGKEESKKERWQEGREEKTRKR